MQQPQPHNPSSQSSTVNDPDPLHHLLRVRIRKNIFKELKVVANEQTTKVGEYISISDLVRAAIGTYLQVQKSKDRLELQLNPKEPKD